MNLYLKSLNPTILFDNILSLEDYEDTFCDISMRFKALMSLGFIFKNILISVLIYESIKSFRKFSRKL